MLEYLVYCRQRDRVCWLAAEEKGFLMQALSFVFRGKPSAMRGLAQRPTAKKAVQKRSGQAGFAIGLVLLVVGLIAVIMAAIANSTRNSGNSVVLEGNRLGADLLLKQTGDWTGGFQRMAVVAGIKPYQITVVRSTAATTFQVATNMLGPYGMIPDQVPLPAAYMDGCGTSINADNHAAGCMWYLSRGNLGEKTPYDATTTATEAATADYFVYTFFLNDAVCRQINNVFYGDDIGLDPIVVSNTSTAILGFGKIYPPAANQSFATRAPLNGNASAVRTATDSDIATRLDLPSIITLNGGDARASRTTNCGWISPTAGDHARAGVFWKMIFPQ
jgi:hypothetical protein